MTHSALALTRPYPFARLRKLFEGACPPEGLKPISLGIGEPRHPIPKCIAQAIAQNIGLMGRYPATGGEIVLRETIASWCEKRYGVALDPTKAILPVLGSREALFSFIQSHIDTSRPDPVAVIPTPFYQIYEGAALLAGARPVFVPLTAETGFKLNLSHLDEQTLAKTQVVFVCSPGNPTGAVMTLQDWKQIFELSDRYGFTIASDECYSEIYFQEGNPPLGALTAAKLLGRDDMKNIIVFQSLSKRSNVPGMRSGFVAGDHDLIKPFLLYRTYHGSAMNPMIQRASIVAWGTEDHVIENRRLYREKFAVAYPILSSVLDAPMPEASFYIWTRVPGSDEAFARALYANQGVTVLPGSYLSREACGANPGAGYVRIALVAEPDEVREASERIAKFMNTYNNQN